MPPPESETNAGTNKALGATWGIAFGAAEVVAQIFTLSIRARLIIALVFFLLLVVWRTSPRVRSWVTNLLGWEAAPRSLPANKAAIFRGLIPYGEKDKLYGQRRTSSNVCTS